MVQRGDDLEDDFVPDDLVVLSGDEAQVLEDDSKDVQTLLSPDEEHEKVQSDDQPQPGAKKRKRREKEKEKKASVRRTLRIISLSYLDARNGGFWKRTPDHLTLAISLPKRLQNISH